MIEKAHLMIRPFTRKADLTLNTNTETSKKKKTVSCTLQKNISGTFSEGF